MGNDSGNSALNKGVAGREQSTRDPDALSGARERHEERQRDFLARMAGKTLARLQAQDARSAIEEARETPIVLEDLIAGTHPPLAVKWFDHGR